MAFQISGTTIVTDNRTFTKYGDTLNALGNTGANPNIDLSSGNFVSAILNQNATFTFSNPTTNACAFTLFLSNDGTGGRSIIWPVAVVWPGGTTPTATTTANKTDVYTFFTLNSGTTWYGNIAQYNYS